MSFSFCSVSYSKSALYVMFCGPHPPLLYHVAGVPGQKTSRDRKPPGFSKLHLTRARKPPSSLKPPSC